jgi:Tol biopolymer transport system component
VERPAAQLGALSPDVAKLGAEAGEANACIATYSVNLISPAGGNPTRVAGIVDSSQGELWRIGATMWAPDGRQVGVLADGDRTSTLWQSVDTVNSSVTPLTSLSGRPWYGWDWAPDSSYIANGFWSLQASVDVDIADVQANSFATLDNGWSPAWRQAGKGAAAASGQIAYVSSNTTTIYLQNADGTAKQMLYTGLVEPSELVWSPDETQLALAATSGGLRCLYTLDVSSKQAKQIACVSYRVWEPRWSPDGQQLAFWGLEDPIGPFAVWTVSASGGTPTRLGSSLPIAITPDWLDKDTVLFTGEPQEGTWRIYRVNIFDPDNLQQVGPDIQCDAPCPCTAGSVLALYPVPSPNRTQVAYVGASTRVAVKLTYLPMVARM